MAASGLLQVVQFLTLRVIVGEGETQAAPIDNMRDQFLPGLDEYAAHFGKTVDNVVHVIIFVRSALAYFGRGAADWQTVRRHYEKRKSVNLIETGGDHQN